MTIESWALECAVRRHWFRKPKDEGVPLPLLEQTVQNAVVAEAIRIQQEERCEPSN